MRYISGTSSLLLLTSVAFAQTQYFTSPKGFNLSEGNTEVFTSQPFYGANTRFQFLDGTQAGTSSKVLKSLELRRRPTEVPGPYPARTTNLTVILAHTTQATASTTFATNYKGGLSTTVFSGSFNLPDFSAGPVAMPAPWSILIPYTTNFVYNGTDDLLVELQCAGTTPASTQYPLDCVDAVAVPGGYSVYNGNEPCTVSGHSFPFWSNVNNDPTFAGNVVSYDFYATDAPNSQPGAVILGLGQIYNDLGGALCAHIQPTLDITIPVTTSAIGDIGTAGAPIALSYAYPGFVHKVFVQFVALNPTSTNTIPVALSDDIKYTVGDTGPYALTKVSTTTSSTATTGTLSSFYLPIMRHGY